MDTPRGSDEAQVLAANQTFYDAFSSGDLSALDDLWAEHAPVSCIHPGWDALHGRDEVMASWQAILAGDGDRDVGCLDPIASILGDAALVICNEEIDDHLLIATNVFVREGGRWRLCHHQAGPVSGQRPEGRPRRRAKVSPGMLN